MVSVATRSISTTPGWDANPSQGYPPALIFTGTHSYTGVERGTKAEYQRQNFSEKNGSAKF